MSRIDLMIVGAQKAATSSLHRYLEQHPQICTHPQMECGYFVDDDEFERGWEQAESRYFAGCAEAADGDQGQRLIAKSVDVMYMPEAVERLRAHNPDVHAVVVLREPIARAHSAYVFARRRGWETAESFREAVEAELSGGPPPVRLGGVGRYVSNSVYADWVEALFAALSRERVHVALVEDLKADAPGLCRALFAALGVDPGFEPDTAVRHNVAAAARSQRMAHALASRRGVMGWFRRHAPPRVLDAAKSLAMRFNEQPVAAEPVPEDLRESLAAYFRDDVARLGALVNRDLAVWTSGWPQPAPSGPPRPRG